MARRTDRIDHRNVEENFLVPARQRPPLQIIRSEAPEKSSGGQNPQVADRYAASSARQHQHGTRPAGSLN